MHSFSGVNVSGGVGFVEELNLIVIYQYLKR